MTEGLFAFPDFEATTYSLWFRTEKRGWAAWSSKSQNPATAAAQRPGCLRKFPDAKTILVKHTEKREGLNRNREANLTHKVAP